MTLNWKRLKGVGEFLKSNFYLSWGEKFFFFLVIIIKAEKKIKIREKKKGSFKNKYLCQTFEKKKF